MLKIVESKIQEMLIIVDGASHSMRTPCGSTRNCVSFSKQVLEKMELAGCYDKWVDVFVTKDNRKYAHEFDDVFCCSVQSIQFDPDTDGMYPNAAYVSETSSDWILPTWSPLYDQASASTSEYNNIEVGDTIRIGSTSHKAQSVYHTVLEKRHVSCIINASSTALSLGLNSSNGVEILPIPVDNTVPQAHVLSTNGIAHIALRLNSIVKCTRLDASTLKRDRTLPGTEIHLQGVTVTGAATTVDLSNRHLGYVYLKSNSEAYAGEQNDTMGATEKYFWPLYRCRTWNDSTALVAHLDNRVKQCSALKLIGYSLVNKRQVGLAHSHEIISDDFLILRAKEIDGQVMSNNTFANGALAILPTTNSTDHLYGTNEYSKYEPGGIVCIPVTQSTLKDITFEVVDRLGKPAHFGRLHIWLKLLVKHG